MTKEEIIREVWPDTFVEETNLRVNIAALRKALGDGRDGRRYIVNIPGRGYCFTAPVSCLNVAPFFEAKIASTPSASNLPTRITRVIGRDDEDILNPGDRRGRTDDDARASTERANLAEYLWRWTVEPGSA